jgi:hypothetical protein
MVRTYKEAVEIAVNWWVEKSFNTKLNQNNGDNSQQGGLTFILMNTLSLKAQERNTPDKIEKFKTELTKLLLSVENGSTYRRRLSVDYGPNEMLFKACELSGIDISCLPCKTYTIITSENKVEGSYQYRGELFSI